MICRYCYNSWIVYSLYWSLLKICGTMSFFVVHVYLCCVNLAMNFIECCGSSKYWVLFDTFSVVK